MVLSTSAFVADAFIKIYLCYRCFYQHLPFSQMLSSATTFVTDAVINSYLCYRRYYQQLGLLHIEGSRPECCISSTKYTTDAPFWSETLDMLMATFTCDTDAIINSYLSYRCFYQQLPVLRCFYQHRRCHRHCVFVRYHCHWYPHYTIFSTTAIVVTSAVISSSNSITTDVVLIVSLLLST